MKAKSHSFSPSRLAVLPLALLLGFVAGCDQLTGALGVETPAHKSARLDAEGKAVGGGCRQSGRAIEDCYSIYSWLPKESVFSGWLDMDAYMRENNLETVMPLLPPAPPPGKRRTSEANGAETPVGPVPVPAPMTPDAPPANAVPAPNVQGTPLSAAPNPFS